MSNHQNVCDHILLSQKMRKPFIDFCFKSFEDKKNSEVYVVIERL